jgi:16S rRNA (adenine1518-N6/adenine1519-N6)-dimethyltransferase
MALYKPSELHALLNRLNKKPCKRASQNFLIDKHVLDQMLNASAISEKDYILEIGPGPGALTEALLETHAHVIAVERDHDFARELLTWNHPRLKVFDEDILKTPIDALFSKQNSNKVVANLPYHITTPILEKLLSYGTLFKTLTIMVQKEMADRMVALPGTSNYSSLTIFLQTQVTIEYNFTVNANCYYPKPSVNSSVITLTLRDEPLVPLSNQKFFAFIQTLFQQRRKMMRAALSKELKKEVTEEILHTLNLPPTTRAETLSIETLKAFFNAYL